jgi:alpha-L-rhamnosidase
MWERWNGWTPKDGFGDVSMNSFNHYAFGSVGEYLYSTVGGIRPDTPGYQKIIIKPAIEDGLSWEKTSFESLYGEISTSWRRAGQSISLDVTVPCNTTATICVPADNVEQVLESGGAISEADGVTVVRQEAGVVVLTVGSGTYAFTTVLPTRRP